jgi:xylulokinase
VPPENYILAIDLGTSALKVALVNANGEILACEQEPQNVILLPNGGAEQNPAEWWNAIVRAAKRVLAQNNALLQNIAAVACTTQWSGTVPVDRAGKPLRNAIIWMDARGAPYVNRVTGGGIAIEGYNVRRLVPWLRKTGGIPGHAGKDSLAHILWLKHERPDVYNAAHKFLEPKDYLNFKLTGTFAAGYDSIILHWVTDNRNIARVEYDAQLLNFVGVARDKLPDLKSPTAVLGTITPEIARELGLRDDVRVVMGTPDVQSAAIGSGAVRDFDAHLYVGTSAWLCCHVPFKKTDLMHNMASLPSALPKRYLLTNEQESAGACLAYLRDNVFFADDALNTPKPANAYRAFDAIAAGVPAGSGKLIFMPWLYGERTPVEDHSVRGGFFNQSLQTTRAHMIRAVMEGVAYNARWLRDAVEKFCARQITALNFIGGGANSDVWCQIFADVLNCEIRQVREPVQANVRGVSLLAAVSLGWMSPDEIPAHVAIQNTFAPNAAHRKMYDELFREFLNIYKANKNIYARLNHRA